MMRYLSLYAAFVRFSFSQALEFRFDFFFRIMMDSVFYIVNMIMVKLIYLQTSNLAGWREDEMMIFVSVFFISDAIYMTIFSSNMWWLPTMINKGDLDYYLLRPVSSLFFMTLRVFSVNSVVNLIMAVGIFFWALSRYQGEVTMPDFLLLCFTTLLGTGIYFMMSLIFVLPVFWTHSGKGFQSLYFSLTRFIEKPDRIFIGAVRFILVTVLPLSLVASFPATLFFKGFDWQLFLHLLGVTVIYALIILAIWRAGLRAYSSASS